LLHFDVYRPLVIAPRHGAYYFSKEKNVVVFDAYNGGCSESFAGDQSEPVIREGMDGAWNPSPFFTAIPWLDFDCSGIQ
jgi:hypothetical protein